jgi:hypothetical protein
MHHQGPSAFSPSDHSLAAVGPSRVAYIPHDALRRLTNEKPRIAAVLWRDTLIDASVFREWNIVCGRRALRRTEQRRSPTLTTRGASVDASRANDMGAGVNCCVALQSAKIANGNVSETKVFQVLKAPLL